MIACSDIPRRFHWALEPGAVTLPPAVDAEVQRVLAGLADGPRPRGLFLHGPVGCGKTTCAVAILGELRRRQDAQEPGPHRLPSGWFLSDGDVIRRARAAMEVRGLEAFDVWAHRLVERRNLVVLDDLAAGGESPYTQYESRILNDIVDLLYREQQVVLVTSNKSLDELARVLGDRVPSRLTEMAVAVLLDGRDRRLGGAA